MICFNICYRDLIRDLVYCFIVKLHLSIKFSSKSFAGLKSTKSFANTEFFVDVKTERSLC